jgi:chromosome partitioning protein
MNLLRDMPFPLLETAIAERQAYRALISYGGTLAQLNPKAVPGIETAIINANALANEIVSLLGGDK